MGLLDNFSEEEGENRIMTMGYDVKITPANWPVIIEINGKDSGIYGLEVLEGKKETERRETAYLKTSAKYGAVRTDQNFDKRLQDVVFWGTANGCKLDPQTFLSLDPDNMRKKAERIQLKRIIQRWMEENPDHKEIIMRHCNPDGRDDPKTCQEKILQGFWGVVDFFYHCVFGYVFICDPAIINKSPARETFREFLAHLSSYHDGIDPKIVSVDQAYLGESLWLYPKHIKMGREDILLEKPGTNLKDITKIISKFLGSSGDTHLPAIPYIITGDGFPIPDLGKLLKMRPKRYSVIKPPAGNPDVFESIAKDKIGQKAYIPQEYRTSICENGDQIQAFLDMIRRKINFIIDVEKFPYVVIKPRSGIKGDGVEIFNINDGDAISKKLASMPENDRLIEAFVPSKPIVEPMSGQEHDGCMRYLLDILVQKKGAKIKYRPIFETAYWRLSPRPLIANADLNDRFRANFAKEAIPAPCAQSEIKIAREAVMDSVRLIMEALTR